MCPWPVNFKVRDPGGCFTNVSRALQNNLAKIYNARNHIYYENFKLKLCTCAQSMALGTRTKYQLEIVTKGKISAIHKFRENILESSRNVNETPPVSLDWFNILWYLHSESRVSKTIRNLKLIDGPQSDKWVWNLASFLSNHGSIALIVWNIVLADDFSKYL